MSVKVLWSSYSIESSNKDIKLYQSLKDKFNINILEKDKNKESKENKKQDILNNDNQNKLTLEKINNYINEFKNEKKINLNKLNLLEVLKEQELLCVYLCKYVLQNNYLNYDFFTGSLNVLKCMSEFLRKDLKQKKFSHDLKKIKISNSIQRSSYKFCHFKDSCIYNYDSKKNGCYADHYVHNLVEADLEALLEYIDNNYQENIINHNKEIIKCINTLCFVIKHMTAELNSLCLYCEPSEYKNLHINKIVKKKNKKNKKKKSKKKN